MHKDLNGTCFDFDINAISNSLHIDKPSNFMKFIMEMGDMESLKNKLDDKEYLDSIKKESERMCMETFITPNMYYEFAYISKDFFLNCFNGISSDIYEEYINGAVYESDLVSVFNKRIINYIYSMAKKGDKYCYQNIIYLYKTYYKKEYNQLKKFKKIKGEDVLNLSLKENGDISVFTTARILTFSSLLNIEISSDCSLLYYILNKKYYELRDELLDLSGLNDEDDLSEIPDEIYDDALEQINSWCKYIPEPYIKQREFRPMREAIEAVNLIFNSLQFPNDYLHPFSYNEEDMLDSMAYVLSVIRTKHPRKKYSFEIIQIYSVIYNFMEAFLGNAEHLEYYADILFDLSEFKRNKKLYNFSYNNGESVSINNKNEKNDKNDTDKSNEAICPQDESFIIDKYKKQIEELKNEKNALQERLKDKVSENNHLKNMYSSLKSEINTLQEKNAEYVNDREELIVLRNYVYHLSDEEEDISAYSQDDMRDFIAQKKVVIVGGHNNWIYKLRQMFKNWEFVSPEASSGFDEKLLKNADMVYFFSNHISHSMYLTCKNYVQKEHIPFGYISSVNIDKNIEQVFKELSEIH